MRVSVPYGRLVILQTSRLLVLPAGCIFHHLLFDLFRNLRLPLVLLGLLDFFFVFL